MRRSTLAILGGLFAAVLASCSDDGGGGGSGGGTNTSAVTTKGAGPGPTVSTSTKASSAAMTTSASSSSATTATAASTSASASTGMAGCTPLTWTFSEKLASGSIIGTLSPNIGAADVDKLQFDFYTDATGMIELGTGINLKPENCDQCAVVVQDADAAEVYFFATSGTLSIEPMGTPSTGDVKFNATNLKLEEYTVDGQVWTPVVDGGCVSVAMAGGDFLN